MDMPTPYALVPGVPSQAEGADTELVPNTPYPFPYTGAPVETLPVIQHVNFAADPAREGRIKRELVPIPASEVMRYHRAVKIRNKTKTHIIPPNTHEMRDDDRSHTLYRRAGWQSRVHPEGALYFWHPEMRAFTDANLIKKGTLEAIMRAIADLQAKIKTENIIMPPHWELVLEVAHLRKARQVGYYFVNHGNRCLFWLHDYDVAPMLGNVKGVKFYSHIKYAMEAQFWMHVEFYPNNRKVPRNIFEELKEIVMHASAETITSDTSLAPFDNEELTKICELIDHIEGKHLFLTSVTRNSYSSRVHAGSIDKPYEHSMCIIARFMRMFARTRFFNFCGQIGARLDADQTVYYRDKRRRSILLRIMSPFLFGAPDVHMKALKTIWVDQLVNHIPWKKFVDKLNDEWMGYTLYSTVILNSNVAFLALMNVSPQADQNAPANTPYPQTPAQIASYVSTVASMGSVIVGLLLLRQNRTKGRESAEDAVYFMTTVTNTMFGTETLAIIYSLPFGLLLWGMVFFVVAFCFLALQQTSLTTRGTVGAAGVLVLIFVLWSVTAAWERPRWLTAHYGWDLVSEWIKTIAKLLGIDAKARSSRGRSRSRRRSRSQARKAGRSAAGAVAAPSAGASGSASTSGSDQGDTTTEVDTESENGQSDEDDD
ncbi:hypothetical protein CONPUDRAFT_149421 [Coniophora puteana RWD-64-598 SS2]|uniref:WW domain-containing protein n=1 Tax=Coniophora puteana (strain RWD-64-598) TaxID=741705 RepID=A0A5M3N7W7_CONPW|nr:uncharacterized protein CONPUDRAFT_149421 [Coniophora puteana RWD-64-598 SS2]EIW87388.1 hypothetical protein CONPUDRAFT_149421 [Coniophora puteana RWD-64-598 SS2]